MIQYTDFTSAFSIRDGVILTVSGYSWKFGEDETFIDVIKLNIWNQHKKSSGLHDTYPDIQDMMYM